MNRPHLLLSHIICLLLLVLAALSLYAQPKPKRDKSKDKVSISSKKNNVLTSKRKPLPAKVSKPFVSRKKIRRNRRSRARKVVKDTPFLYVDYQKSPVGTFSYNGGSVYMLVSTDGPSWNVRNIGSWYRVDTYGNGFYIVAEKILQSNQGKIGLRFIVAVVLFG